MNAPCTRLSQCRNTSLIRGKMGEINARRELRALWSALGQGALIPTKKARKEVGTYFSDKRKEYEKEQPVKRIPVKKQRISKIGQRLRRLRFPCLRNIRQMFVIRVWSACFRDGGSPFCERFPGKSACYWAGEKFGVVWCRRSHQRKAAACWEKFPAHSRIFMFWEIPAGSRPGILQSNIAAHLVHDTFADGKAQAASLGTALDKGLEQGVPHGLGDSGAVVIKPEDMGKCSLACLCPYGIIEA